MPKIKMVDDREFLIDAFSDVCFWCKHLITSDKEKRKCKAFNEIPLDIWQGKNKHTKPYKGDGGIRYEPIEQANTRNDT